MTTQNLPITSTKRSFQLYWLAFFIDGWSELIEGMGDKETGVKTALKEELVSRNMPDVKVEQVNAYPTLFSNTSRPYNLTTTSPGATTTIYVAKHGNDLYTSWRTFLTPIINWKLLSNLAKIAAALGIGYGVINIVIGFVSGIYEGFIASTAASNLGKALLLALGWGIGVFIASGILISILSSIYPRTNGFFRIAKSFELWVLVSILSGTGRFVYKYYETNTGLELSWSFILYKVLDPILITLEIFLFGFLVSWILFFILQLSHLWTTSNDFIDNLMVVSAIAGIIIADPIEMWANLGRMWNIFVSNFMSGLYSFEQSIMIILVVIGGGIALLILASIIFQRSLFYYLLEQPTLFDLEDITAMSLTVHKSLLRVLDQQGIDVSKLRIKPTFKSGRKGDEV